MMSRVTAGLLNGTEFFTRFTSDHAEPMCITGGMLFDFNHMPATPRGIVYADMNSQPAIEKALTEMVGDNEDHKLAQFIMCQFGALNTEPDIDENGNLSAPEYVPCVKRGNCKFEGKVCCSIMVREGIFLSKAETEVFKLVQFSNDEIADKLFISPKTVNTHLQNIRLKTGLKNKVEIAIWATKKGII